MKKKLFLYFGHNLSKYYDAATPISSREKNEKMILKINDNLVVYFII